MSEDKRKIKRDNALVYIRKTKNISMNSKQGKLQMKKGEKIAYLKFIIDCCTKSID